ncbi:PAS domain-containing protein [Phreatobacter sp.]|uniref:PAS domain-containing protein n=1 Tax=Phreatobacter sp. TaxID=1966341 RepID=UPI003F6FB098
MTSSVALALPDSRDFLRSVLEASVDCIKLVELDGRLSFMNTNGLCLMEIDDFSQVAGVPWWDLWPDESADQVRAAVEAGRQGRPTRFEACCPTAKGTLRWWDVSVAPIFDEEGTVSRLSTISRDISERKSAEWTLAAARADLLDHQQRLQAIVNSIDQMIWSTQPDGYHDYYNHRWYEFTGVPAGSTDGEAWNGMFHPDDQERAWETWRRCLATGEPYHIEYRLRHHSGQYRWVIGRAQPVRCPDGQIVRWYGTCTDVHELKVSQEQRELIAQELAHRIKNIFAVVGAIVTLSSRSFPEARPYAEGIRGRIDALGRAHRYVMPDPAGDPGSREPGTIRGVLRELLSPYEAHGTDRFSLEGEDPAIGQRTATGLALIVHELATNASKYGALSAPAGHVRIAIGTAGDALRIVWTETGGPRIAAAPKHTGFGTMLSQRVAASQLGLTVVHDWNPEGLVVSMEMPLGQLAQ